MQRPRPGIFANLKEVYLFGCNTLNPESFRNASAEIERSLMRSGQARADAARARPRAGRAPRRQQPRPHAADLPGRARRSTASRRWRRSGRRPARCSPATSSPAAPPSSARGRPSQRLLAHFGTTSLAVASGMPRGRSACAPHRQDICSFADERRSTRRQARLRPRACSRRDAGRSAAVPRPHRGARRRADGRGARDAAGPGSVARDRRATSPRATVSSRSRAMPTSRRCARAWWASRASSAGSTTTARSPSRWR